MTCKLQSSLNSSPIDWILQITFDFKSPRAQETYFWCFRGFRMGDIMWISFWLSIIHNNFQFIMQCLPIWSCDYSLFADFLHSLCDQFIKFSLSTFWTLLAVTRSLNFPSDLLLEFGCERVDDWGSVVRPSYLRLLAASIPDEHCATSAMDDVKRERDSPWFIQRTLPRTLTKTGRENLCRKAFTEASLCTPGWRAKLEAAWRSRGYHPNIERKV